MDLHEARKKKTITQRKLADIAGVSQSSIASYENGTRRPSPEVARQIADALGLSTEEMWEMFFSGDERRCG